MGAKRIQVSADGGTTYRTLPGSTGDYREELATVNDTIFGQDYESNEVSIGQWNIGANGYYKGVSGYVANLKQQGTPTVMTAQVATLVAGTTKTYRIADETRRLIDYFSPLTVLANAVDQTANVVSIDYLNGEVTFASTYTVTGPVTLTGKYVPTTNIARAKSFTVNMTAAEIDETDYETARGNNGWRTFSYGLRSANLDISGIYNVANGAAAALRGRAPLLVDISPDNSTDTFFRGFFKRHNRGQSGDVGALEEETHTLGLWVPDGGLVVRPFGWYFSTATKLNPAMRDCISAWQNKTMLKVRYQSDPDVALSGHVGDAIITECSMSNTLEGLNEFRLGFRGSGAPVAV